MKKILVLAAAGAAVVFLGFRVYQEAAADGPAPVSPGFAGRGGGFSGARGGAGILVETGRLEDQIFRTGREFTGELYPNTEVDVIPRVSGYLQTITVQQADAVLKGQLLAEIDGADLEQQILRQQAALAVAEAGAVREQAALDNLRVQVERNRRMYEEGLIARQVLDDIESNLRVAEAQYAVAGSQVDQARALLGELKIQFERTRVYSPMDGVVSVRHADPGALAGQTTPLVTIIDLTRLKTIVPLPEGSIPDVAVGVPAEVRLDAFPGSTYRGRIVRISPRVDTETRSVDVEIQIENPRAALRPGMFARVSLGGAAAAPAPSIPRAALITRGDTSGVYLLGDGNVAAFRPIEAGRTEGGWIEVRGGLDPGDVFITTGAQNVNDGDTVRVSGAGGVPVSGGAGDGATATGGGRNGRNL